MTTTRARLARIERIVRELVEVAMEIRDAVHVEADAARRHRRSTAPRQAVRPVNAWDDVHEEGCD